MDESFLLMLSNLLHLHNSLDPSTSLLSSASSTPSSSSVTSSSPSSSLLTTSSAAPLLFFTLASLLSFLACSKPNNKNRKSGTSPRPAPPANGAYTVAVFQSLSNDWTSAPLRDAQWRALYGLSYPVFTKIVEKLNPHIAASNLSLPSDFAVSMVLFRLAHGYSAKSLASRYNLEPYLISKITNMVTRLLATKLYPEYVKIPASKRRLNEVTLAFEELTSLPNMCGAIDGTPIKLRSFPTNESNLYRCEYGYPALQLQVVSDHKKMFWDVCVKAPGAVDDATHFRDSLLYNRLVSDDIVWDKVINVRGHHVRPYVVGDWCYPLMAFLMTPFSPNGSGSPAQNLFDGMLMKGRSVVVDAIGLLKSRWRILQDLDVGLSHAPQTIVACCVLHNVCQQMREPEPDVWREPDETAAPARVLESEKSFHYFGDSLRQALADDLHHRLSSR
ncbi:unnamed protein product [Linum trigynum]|uniref:DDE Tnp4 domain-containing protein n=1 Tax=Linum trigynum TaxID=586398 RepID=A0AAV2GHD8_9ROSI